MGKGMISASMMCAELGNINELLKIFEHEEIEYLHMDIMDGHFVPNLGLGTDYIQGVRKITNIPLDFHLMVNNPEEKYEWLGIRPTDNVSIHYESTIHVQRAIAKLKPYGCGIFLAINPATPICFIEELLEYIDGINVLMVNPGFAGQSILPNCIKKVERIKNVIENSEHKGIKIEVDGNINLENAKILRDMGADIFVAGTSSIFSRNGSYEDNIAKLRYVIE